MWNRQIAGIVWFLAVFGLLAGFGAFPAQARYVQTVKARYITQTGRSDWYSVDITFATGEEMNQATRSFSYPALGASFGSIFWQQHEATVIQLDNSFCGTEFNEQCLHSHLGNMTGTDQEGRQWEICTSSMCF